MKIEDSKKKEQNIHQLISSKVISKNNIHFILTIFIENGENDVNEMIGKFDVGDRSCHVF